MDDQVRNFRDVYEGRIPAKDMPWPGCANVNVPLTQPIIDALHAHHYKTLFGVEPYYTGVAVGPDSVDDAEAVELALQEICTRYFDLAEVGDEAILRQLVDQAVILSPVWNEQIGKKRRMVKQGGATLTVESEEIVKKGPKVRLIDILDFAVYPADAHRLDWEHAHVMCHRYWQTQNQLKVGARSGMYDPEAVTNLISTPSVSENRNNDWVGGDIARVQDAGIQTDTEIEAKDRPYECFEGLCLWDLDEDGEDEVCLFRVALNEDKLLFFDRYPYIHDQPFYVPISTLLRPWGVWFGYSTAERLQSLQSEINAIHNQREDRATLENAAPLVASKELKRDLEKTTMGPGTVLYADSPKDAIVPVSFSSGSQRSVQDEEAIKQMAFYSSGVNDTILGQSSSSSSTLGEIERNLQSVNVKFDLQADRQRRGWSQVGQQLLLLAVQYMDDEWQYRTGAVDDEGQPIFKTITRDQLANGTNVTVRGTSPLANPVLQAQRGEKMYLVAERNPLISNDPGHMWEVTKYYFKHSLQIPDFARFIGTKEEAIQKSEQAQQAQNAPPPPPPPPLPAPLKPAINPASWGDIIALADAMIGEHDQNTPGGMGADGMPLPPAPAPKPGIDPAIIEQAANMVIDIYGDAAEGKQSSPAEEAQEAPGAPEGAPNMEHGMPQDMQQEMLEPMAQPMAQPMEQPARGPML